MFSSLEEFNKKKTVDSLINCIYVSKTFNMPLKLSTTEGTFSIPLTLQWYTEGLCPIIYKVINQFQKYHHILKFETALFKTASWFLSWNVWNFEYGTYLDSFMFKKNKYLSNFSVLTKTSYLRASIYVDSIKTQFHVSRNNHVLGCWLRYPAFPIASLRKLLASVDFYSCYYTRGYLSVKMCYFVPTDGKKREIVSHMSLHIMFLNI